MGYSNVKISEMRERSIDELNDSVIDLKKRLFQLRMDKAMHKLENISEIRTVKNRIAQIKTVIREKQLTK